MSRKFNLPETWHKKTNCMYSKLLLLPVSSFGHNSESLGTFDVPHAGHTNSSLATKKWDEKRCTREILAKLRQKDNNGEAECTSSHKQTKCISAKENWERKADVAYSTVLQPDTVSH